MKRAKGIIYILISWFVVHEAVIIVDGITAKEEKSEFTVIFGNTVHPDGSLSDRLKARVDKGLALYQDSLADQLFVSGGLGKEGHYEAQKMAEYLIKHGVPKSKIIIDNHGNNSWLTASNFRKMEPDCESVIVVTQFYHISRAKLAFKKLGIDKVSAACPSYFELRDFYSLFREFFGYYLYLLVY